MAFVVGFPTTFIIYINVNNDKFYLGFRMRHKSCYWLQLLAFNSLTLTIYYKMLRINIYRSYRPFNDACDCLIALKRSL